MESVREDLNDGDLFEDLKNYFKSDTFCVTLRSSLSNSTLNLYVVKMELLTANLLNKLVQI